VSRKTLISAGTVWALALAVPIAMATGTAKTGPTTTVAPYVLPVAEGVEITSLLTVGDKPAGNGYKMIGIPDGLGVRDAGSGKLELYMNHELPAAAGTERAHGRTGSFVADLTIDRATLAVQSGKELIDSPADVTY